MKAHTVGKMRKVWGQISVLLQWVVFGPGFGTTAPKRSSLHPPLFTIKSLSYSGKTCGGTATLQILPYQSSPVSGCSHSDTVFANFAVGQSLGTSHLSEERCCRSSATPGSHHSGSSNCRKVRGWRKSKQQLVLKWCLCRGMVPILCLSPVVKIFIQGALLKSTWVE